MLLLLGDRMAFCEKKTDNDIETIVKCVVMPNSSTTGVALKKRLIMTG